MIVRKAYKSFPHRFTLQINDEQRHALGKLAGAYEISMNEYVRMLIDEAIEDYGYLLEGEDVATQ